MSRLIRSLLFVPGSRPERFEKALNAGADMICIDLEDAVLAQYKSTARQSVIQFLQGINEQRKEQVCVRVNPINTSLGQDDLTALARVQPAAIMLAKCEDAAQVKTAKHELNSPNTYIIPLVETLQGLNNAVAIASADKCVKEIMFGGADMASELCCEFSYEPLLFVRSQLVIAAATANVGLIDVPFIDIKNASGLLNETVKISALGFTGKAAIHPCQVAQIHAGFTPSEAQVEYASRAVNAASRGDGGAIVIDGKMIDGPIVIACERILKLAKQAN